MFASPLVVIGSGGRIRTYDLWVMSPTSYQTAPPRVKTAVRPNGYYSKRLDRPQLLLPRIGLPCPRLDVEHAADVLPHHPVGDEIGRSVISIESPRVLVRVVHAHPRRPLLDEPLRRQPQQC